VVLGVAAGNPASIGASSICFACGYLSGNWAGMLKKHKPKHNATRLYLVYSFDNIQKARNQRYGKNRFVLYSLNQFLS
jgi:hypothetical protein